ncbi:MAG: hypothetical protein J6Z79_05195 [Clostridia bacterium]|nr:hypothetical protein [Clostridia bacterium]
MKRSDTADGRKDLRQVPSPIAKPVYTFDHDPTPEEMRAMAIRAMHDMVSVQWFPKETVRYRKQGAVSNKQFEFLAEKYYMGLPYTSAGMGLFQFLAFYDEKTGCLNFTDQDRFNLTIGNSCASSVGWGLAAVCSSISGSCISNFLTISNGFLPLGGVTYDPAITDLKTYETKRIIEDNGPDKVLAGYCAVQPGDVLFYAEDTPAAGHTRMALEAAQVVRNPDGSIDPDQSTITTQEQAAKDHEDTSSGILMYRGGQISKTYTFNEFLKKNYIAVSTAEFLGKKPYETCHLTYEGKSDTPADLAAGALRCNYPMAILRLLDISEDGEKVLLHRLFDRKMIGSGLARHYPLAELFAEAEETGILPARGASLALEITASTGEVFRPVTVKIR